jgi:hypothetical protein
VLELVASLDGPRDPDAEEAWVAEIERRPRSVLPNPESAEIGPLRGPRSTQNSAGREAKQDAKMDR